MSLINDALKKAQRLRAEAASAADAGPGRSGGKVEKRGQPMRAQTIILLATAGTVLVVLSVVVTVYLLTRPDPAPVRPAAIASKPAAPTADAAPPTIVVPLPAPKPAETPPANVAAETAAPAPASLAKAPSTAAASTSESVKEITPAPVAATHEPISPPAANTTPTAPKSDILPASRISTAPATPVAPTPDARVQMFVDSIRVTGIRSSGNDSKVLMNDRVYRVNDLVDRTLGLKLVKVEADRLTFTDPNGLTYTKNF